MNSRSFSNCNEDLINHFWWKTLCWNSDSIRKSSINSRNLATQAILNLIVLKWVNPDNWHITPGFPGNIIDQLLVQLWSGKSFCLKAYFPPKVRFTNLFLWKNWNKISSQINSVVELLFNSQLGTKDSLSCNNFEQIIPGSQMNGVVNYFYCISDFFFFYDLPV